MSPRAIRSSSAISRRWCLAGTCPSLCSTNIAQLIRLSICGLDSLGRFCESYEVPGIDRWMEFLSLAQDTWKNHEEELHAG